MSAEEEREKERLLPNLLAFSSLRVHCHGQKAVLNEEAA